MTSVLGEDGVRKRHRPNQKWRSEHAEQTRQYMREWKLKNPDKVKEQRDKYYKKNREAIQERRKNSEAHKSFMKAYRTTQKYKDIHRACGKRYYEQRKAEREAATGAKPIVCDACKRAAVLVWDHCHVSEKFRGWICNRCNLALGQVKDDPEVLRALIAYLENSVSRT